MGQDYYRILGIREDASEEEIRKRYRALARKYHPDANQGDREAEKKFKEIGEAYEVLGDEKKRRIYDRERAAKKQEDPVKDKKTGTGAERNAGAAFDFSDVSSRFEQFFGFNPKTDEVHIKNQEKKTNPLDVTDMFERYMGFGRK